MKRRCNGFGNSVERNFVLSTMFNLFRLYQKDNILRQTRSTFVTVFGDEVECCFDIVAGVNAA